MKYLLIIFLLVSLLSCSDNKVYSHEELMRMTYPDYTPKQDTTIYMYPVWMFM